MHGCVKMLKKVEKLVKMEEVVMKALKKGKEKSKREMKAGLKTRVWLLRLIVCVGTKEKEDGTRQKEHEG